MPKVEDSGNGMDKRKMLHTRKLISRQHVARPRRNKMIGILQNYGDYKKGMKAVITATMMQGF